MDKTLSPYKTVYISQELTFFNQAHIWMFTPSLHNALEYEPINRLNHLGINIELGARSSLHEFLERDLIFLTDYVSRSHQRKVGRKGNEGIIQVLLERVVMQLIITKQGPGSAFLRGLSRCRTDSPSEAWASLQILTGLVKKRWLNSQPPFQNLFFMPCDMWLSIMVPPFLIMLAFLCEFPRYLK